MKKFLIPCALTACIIASTLSFSSCSGDADENVLRIASWDEYIDEGGAESYLEGSRAIYEEFEDWYFEQTGKKITVEYVTLQDNETMYNKIKMGDSYDLLCPSEYMIMKLAEEGKLQKYPASFFDPSIETNYYAQNLSPFIKERLSDESLQLSDGSKLSEYTAGYMWGSTGFVFDPEKITREQVETWNIFTSDAVHRKITAKDNVRDTYFVGLGIYYENELLDLKRKYQNSEITFKTYQNELSKLMNDTSPQTVSAVQGILEKMRKNLYGLETDEGKLDIAMGRFDVSYQWSGDAVYVLDIAEDEKYVSNPRELEYCIPEASSNLWFDGWVMMKDSKMTDAAMAFVNYVSRPDNVVRNMYYIGYTSCIAGDEVFEYLQDPEVYGAGDEEGAPYDLSYFFGDGYILNAYIDQVEKHRQLYAQYPTPDTLERLVVMRYFDKATNEKVNRMWNMIK